MEQPVRVDEENSFRWAAVAQSARIVHRAVSLIGDPQPGSNLARAAELYPLVRVSDRVRAYLLAGIEHLLVWADLAAPLKFHEDQIMYATLRPAYTLARATIEASAQAVWLLDTLDPIECIRRHLSLIRWDLQEHRKSKIDPSVKDAIKAEEDELLRYVSQEFQPDDIKPPGGYLDVIRSACAANGLKLDAGSVEWLWRAASGAAHGKYWPTLELQDLRDAEGHEPGSKRTFQVPNASAMTEVLEVATAMSQYGVVLFAQYCGVDVAAVLGEAMVWLAERVPLKAGVTRANVMGLPRFLPWPDATPSSPEDTTPE